MCSNACSIILITLFSLGARPALPMGVAPEAIVEKKSGMDSRIPAACLVFPRYHLHKQKFISLSSFIFHWVHDERSR
jgi:hypothetical protein